MVRVELTSGGSVYGAVLQLIGFTKPQKGLPDWAAFHHPVTTGNFQNEPRISGPGPCLCFDKDLVAHRIRNLGQECIHATFFAGYKQVGMVVV